MFRKTLSQEEMNAIIELDTAEEQYLDKFGVNSLDRVIYFDPSHPELKDYKEATSILKKAIKRNKPLEQIPVAMWGNMVF